jgi:hypothetical protein
LANWWKCQILSNNKVKLPFAKGDLIYAKGDAEWIMLFDGRRKVMITKTASKNIRVLCRLNKKETELIEQDYRLGKAAKIISSASHFLRPGF